MAIRGRLVFCFLAVLALSSYFNRPAIADDISLSWEPSPSDGISAYRVYIGNTSSLYETTITIGNQTSYTIANLTPGTWYFAVTALDVDGNESDLSNEVSETITLSSQDTTPPIISSVAIASITGAGATISWITNEGSDTQVEYGTTTSYGNSTTAISSLVVSHSQRLTGLMANRLYHYRVRSKDAAGNQAVSGDYVFTAGASSAAPVISNIEVSEITSRSALISWDTNESADSRVEYRSAGEDVRGSTLGFYKTHHSIMLNNLAQQTLYTFKIKSADLDNFQSSSPEYTFTTLENGDLIAVVPRFTDGQDQIKPGEEIAVGIALTNLGSEAADITLTAIASNGELISGQNITNPGALQLSPQNQHAKLDMEIFGFGLERSGSKGWIRLATPSSEVGGFYLAFDSKLSFMDGTNLGEAPLVNFVFPEVETNGYTKIDIVNTNADKTTVNFDLMTADGAIRSTQTRVIEANGALVADLYSDLFADAELVQSDYVRMSSTKGVQSFQLMRKDAGDISSLAGQDLSEGGTILYSPQYVQGEHWSTAISIINLESRAGMITITLLGEDGAQIGQARTIQIPANGKLYIDDPEFFVSLDPSSITSGYVKIMSDGIRLVGSTVFGDSSGTSFTAALPLIHSLQTSVLFSHVASNDLYYTGLAIVNPNEADAYVSIELYAANGSPIAERSIFLPAGQRKTKLLTEFFPSLDGRDQCSGHIRVRSALPMASFAMFGTTSMSALSAIPPQAIR